MILIIDNFDSFTYNLVNILGVFDKLKIFRNDEISVRKIEFLKPRKILISPGPKNPDCAGISLEVIEKLHKKIPILGVCLGHQAIGQFFGGEVVHAPSLFHGKTSEVLHNGKGIYKNLPQNFLVGRYHSLLVKRETLPNCLEITCETKDGLVMGIRHKKFNVQGIQFHPESILTTVGTELLKNWIGE
ncbi:aminodeoxychorismate/anthranilate synthase component II [bacterium]|nr:aminodeoxychorismate/anthranilate synthase component II [bacterium]